MKVKTPVGAGVFVSFRGAAETEPRHQTDNGSLARLGSGCPVRQHWRLRCRSRFRFSTCVTVGVAGCRSRCAVAATVGIGSVRAPAVRWRAWRGGERPIAATGARPTGEKTMPGISGSIELGAGRPVRR